MNIDYFWCGLGALMCNKVTIGLQVEWWSDISVCVPIACLSLLVFVKQSQVYKHFLRHCYSKTDKSAARKSELNFHFCKEKINFMLKCSGWAYQRKPSKWIMSHSPWYSIAWISWNIQTSALLVSYMVTCNSQK